MSSRDDRELTKAVESLKARVSEIWEAYSTNTVNFNSMQERIMAVLDDLIVSVARNGSVIDSAVELIRGLRFKVEAAGQDPSKLQAIVDDLAKQENKLAQAIVAGTILESIKNAPVPVEPPVTEASPVPPVETPVAVVDPVVAPPAPPTEPTQ